MKIRRNLYLIFGIALILLNGIATYWMVQTYELVFTDEDYDVATLIGTQAMTIIGLFLLLGAYRVQRKINRKKKRELENAFIESTSQQ